MSPALGSGEKVYASSRVDLWDESIIAALLIIRVLELDLIRREYLLSHLLLSFKESNRFANRSLHHVSLLIFRAHSFLRPR